MALDESAASYRLYAAYCLEIAQDTTDPARKVALLNMVQAWTRLADHAAKNVQAALAQVSAATAPDR